LHTQKKSIAGLFCCNALVTFSHFEIYIIGAGAAGAAGAAFLALAFAGALLLSFVSIVSVLIN